MFRSQIRYGWTLAILIAAANVSPIQAQCQPPATAAANGNCQNCQHCKLFCCPKTKHCTEGPPCICFIPACNLPSQDICKTQAPNWGYYQTCWSPWPWGPDWSHCPVQPPASLVWPPGPPTQTNPPDMLPTPNRVLPPPRVDPGSALSAPVSSVFLRRPQQTAPANPAAHPNNAAYQTAYQPAPTRYPAPQTPTPNYAAQQPALTPIGYYPPAQQYQLQTPVYPTR